mgnify:FL=1
MKKSVLKSVIAVIVFVFASVNFCSASDFAYKTETANGLVMTKYVYKVEGENLLQQYRKYSFSYDANKRVVSKTVEQWNEDTQKWEKQQTYAYTYNDNACSITLTTFKDNKEVSKDVCVNSIPNQQTERNTLAAK